ncbi:MAG: response regulator transcription factor [Nitrospirae bacterium]|nr:response regulator transcription factor [Nitrospirota bacterium]
MKNRILTVDDDRDILKVLKANLELHGYEVDTAESWTKAQEILTTRQPDMIILDIMLPDGDGIEICRHLRKESPQIPIILLTARDKVSDKVMGLEIGADDYVVKPFETLELIARIGACLRRVCPITEDEVVIGNLKVDFKKQIVTVSGKKVELTPKEYKLLCFFINNRGEVMDRETIRKTIWKDSHIYSWSRVIDVHIQHLRQKIEKDPSNPKYLLTVPGAGYRFMD